MWSNPARFKALWDVTGLLGGDGVRFTSDITLFDHFSLFIADELS
jgi:hypothetical protein